MPRPPVKKTVKLAEAQAYGEELGRLKAEAHFRNTTKGDERHLQAHIGKFIDNMAAKVDPLELAAVLGTTWIIHDAIRVSEDLSNRVLKFIQKTPQTPLDFLGKMGLSSIFAAGGALSLTWFMSEQQNTANQATGQPATPASQIDDLWLWVISFVAAFFIVRNADKILSAANQLPMVLGALGL